MSSQNNEELARTLIVSDLDGLYQKHTQMWDMYYSTLKVYGAVICLPLVIAGTLVTAGKLDLAAISSIENIPLVIIYAFIITGIIGIVLLLALIRNRLDIILYARAINNIRHLYTIILKQNTSLKDWKQFMPVSAKVPEAYELWRPMGNIVLAISIINSMYISIGLCVLLINKPVWCMIAFLILVIILHLLLYKKSCNDKFVLGSDV